MENKQLSNYLTKVQNELQQNILPFWRTRVLDEEHGGFIGRMSNDGTIPPDAPKGLILNTRLLWTFSSLFLKHGEEVDFRLAKRAFDYLVEHFIDTEHGGAFWSVDVHGKPLDTSKKIYGQSFTIYALAEYHQATQDLTALQKAIELFRLVEQKAHDAENKGYLETFIRDWSTAEDLRLSAIDMNEKKSMNTHLHVLEAYTNLYRVWPDSLLQNRLYELIQVFTRHIIHPNTHHFILFFNEQWAPKSDHISYGHDIEGSWLLWEAAHVLKNPQLLRELQPIVLRMAEAVLREALSEDGGVPYEAGPDGLLDADRHWWVQAEAAVGFLNAYQLSRELPYLQASEKCWDYILQHIVDRDHGEWFWNVDSSGVPNPGRPKVSEWKCPYHNTRAGIELSNRLTALGEEEILPKQ